MSFTEDKRSKIKYYILEKIENGQNDFIKKTSEVFEISLNTVYRYVKELLSEGIIEKSEDGYRLAAKMENIAISCNENKKLEEDVLFELYFAKYVERLPDNVKRIWQYSFMEMMNNAIEHSRAGHIGIVIVQNYISTTVWIMDDGIGIFEKIKDYYHYDSLDDAVNELFKGKLTTDSENHSGEGIFFTSRILDRFAAISDGKVFTHDKYRENLRDLRDIEKLDDLTDRKGTLIHMQLSNYSNKVLRKVFDMFSNEEGGFTKTQIPIKNIFETYPVSRSQARRLTHRFEKFEEIELDFEGIDEIGQGFAHELFVKFQREHASVKLIPVNVSKEVEKMIRHVTYSM